MFRTNIEKKKLHYAEFETAFSEPAALNWLTWGCGVKEQSK